MLIIRESSGTGLTWIRDFVSDEMGFHFGAGAYWPGFAVLRAQMAAWLLAYGLLLSRRERM